MKSILFAAATALVIATSAAAFAGEAEGDHIARPIVTYTTATTSGSASEPSFTGQTVQLNAALPQTSRGSDAEPVFASAPAQAQLTIAGIASQTEAN